MTDATTPSGDDLPTIITTGREPTPATGIEAGDQLEFRYMKAIPTRSFCLQCHGVELAPGVSEALARLYPDDLGTGFREGDIRGAFVARGVIGD